MIILHGEHLSFSSGEHQILTDVTFQLQEKDRMGIVGINGAGKSTLFRLITSDLAPTGGHIGKTGNKRIGMLAQNDIFQGTGTVLSEMLCAFSPLLEMQRQLQTLQAQMEISEEKQTSEKADHSPSDSSFFDTNSDNKSIANTDHQNTDVPPPTAAELQNEAQRQTVLAQRYAVLYESYCAAGGLTFVSRTKSMLTHMGFPQDTWEKPVETLSGGQKTRLALIRLLLEEPDILLLDEPTNHLDMETTEWLEKYLKTYPKALIVISHDRYFLDEVTNITLHIFDGVGKQYDNCNYSAFAKRLEKDRAVQTKHYLNQQKEIRRQEAYIAKQRQWNRQRNIIAAESRQKALDRMEKVDRPKDDPRAMQIHFFTAQTSGNDVMYLEHLSKQFDQLLLFSDFSAVIKRQDRLFILGPNGCGKSTLLKIITGNSAPTQGEVIYGSRVCVGYYDQEQQNLSGEDTVLQALWNEHPNLSQTQVRATLAQFRFFADDMDKKVNVLSGGEKARLALAKLVLSKSNVLVLDEPTNHLDIPSREVLEAALEQYPGTLIAVSHDRYFIKKLANRLFDMSHTQIKDYHDGYERYLADRAKQDIVDSDIHLSHTTNVTATYNDISETRQTKPQGLENSSTKKDALPLAAGKAQYLENKARAAAKRRLERQLAKTKEEIQKTEERISVLDEWSARKEYESDYVKLSAFSEEKETLEETLLELYETEETLQKELVSSDHQPDAVESEGLEKP